MVLVTNFTEANKRGDKTFHSQLSRLASTVLNDIGKKYQIPISEISLEYTLKVIIISLH